MITSGIARKPGMSRDDLLNTNAGIVGSVTEQVVKYSPNCIIIIVSNPLDVMTQLSLSRSGFPRFDSSACFVVISGLTPGLKEF